MEWSLEFTNRSGNQDFILLGLSARPRTRDVLFAAFLALYLLILLENTLIIYLTCSCCELRKPMYFFLGNLSGLELCYVSVTMPTLLAGLRAGVCRVSFPACMAQLFLFLALIGTKCTLLASMAYDRYVAVCLPLHYPLRMRPPVCRGLAAGSWLGGLGVSAARTACVARLTRCGPGVLNHFFCDAGVLRGGACGPAAGAKLADALAAGAVVGGSLLAALAAYAAIAVAVLRLPSAAAARRALAACASHLAVMGVFYSAVLFVDSRPGRGHPADLNKVLSLLYTAVTPACSPVVYCLRNRQVQAALQRVLCRRVGSREN
ncbi:olfactory receptor 5-like [Heterocephalus glaber]|uniref:Olfactory receptor 5-like n=1 Tax=Heterocephalus glaber TaxID=10181 RepID=A0AAX6Q879_HETGA|nr:olfactory receptor 5-like [Heterocephalus glaber]